MHRLFDEMTLCQIASAAVSHRHEHVLQWAIENGAQIPSLADIIKNSFTDTYERILSAAHENYTPPDPRAIPNLCDACQHVTDARIFDLLTKQTSVEFMRALLLENATHFTPFTLRWCLEKGICTRATIPQRTLSLSLSDSVKAKRTDWCDYFLSIGAKWTEQCFYDMCRTDALDVFKWAHKYSLTPDNMHVFLDCYVDVNEFIISCDVLDWFASFGVYICSDRLDFEKLIWGPADTLVRIIRSYPRYGFFLFLLFFFLYLNSHLCLIMLNYFMFLNFLSI